MFPLKPPFSGMLQHRSDRPSPQPSDHGNCHHCGSVVCRSVGTVEIRWPAPAWRFCSMAMSNYWMIHGRVKSYNVFFGVFFSEIPFQFRVMLPSSTRLYIYAVFLYPRLAMSQFLKTSAGYTWGISGEKENRSVSRSTWPSTQFHKPNIAGWWFGTWLLWLSIQLGME